MQTQAPWGDDWAWWATKGCYGGKRLGQGLNGITNEKIAWGARRKY